MVDLSSPQGHSVNDGIDPGPLLIAVFITEMVILFKHVTLLLLLLLLLLLSRFLASPVHQNR